MRNIPIRCLGLAGIAAGVLSLAACDQPSPPANEVAKLPPLPSQIESAARSAEKAAGTAVEQTKEAVSSAGEKIESAAEKTKVVASDAAITATVKSKLIADPELKATDINVDTNNGTVTLKGTVDSERNRDNATRVVREVDGVKSVVNQLALRK